MSENCAWCDKPITWQHKLIRLFWAPWWCNMSFRWRTACSPKCYDHILYREAKRIGMDTKDWKL